MRLWAPAATALFVLVASVAANAEMRKLQISSASGSTRIQFHGYNLGEDYTAWVEPLDGSGISDQTFRQESKPTRPIVVGENFGGGKAESQEGLVIIEGRALSAFNFEPAARPRFDTIVCFNKRKVTLLDTSAFRARPAMIGRSCASAVQTYPRVIRDGRSVLPADEDSHPSKVVILAFKGPQAWILVFPTRVDLARVAGVLARPESEGGFGFLDAVRISISAEPSVAYYSSPLVGALDRRLTLAMVFDD